MAPQRSPSDKERFPLSKYLSQDHTAYFTVDLKKMEPISPKGFTPVLLSSICSVFRAVSVRDTAQNCTTGAACPYPHQAQPEIRREGEDVQAMFMQCNYCTSREGCQMSADNSHLIHRAQPGGHLWQFSIMKTPTIPL